MVNKYVYVEYDYDESDYDDWDYDEDCQYDELTRQLLQVHYNNERCKKQVSKRHQTIVKDTVTALITAMKEEDELFALFHKREVYTGSYWEKIRVKFPAEFDINIVLHLPFDFRDVQIIMSDEEPAYFNYQLTNDVKSLLRNDYKWSIINKINKLFDSNGNLLKSEVQKWMQRVINKARDSTYFYKPSDVKRISERQHGPAFTYSITTFQNVIIHVDLVPVIDGSNYQMPYEMKYSQSARFSQLPKAHKRAWFLVPKKYSANFDEDIFWRISLPEAEKKLLLTDNSCVKMLIKLIKLLRDAQGWDQIVSYYIKALFLLELDNYPDPQFWDQKLLGTYFLEMLSKLESAMRTENLSYYFLKESNLLSNMTSVDAQKYANGIQKVRETMCVKPTTVSSYFKQTDPRFQVSNYQKSNNRKIDIHNDDEIGAKESNDCSPCIVILVLMFFVVCILLYNQGG